MKTNEKNISLKEALQLNHRAYKLFYRYYPKLILSQISLTIWKALTPYIIIYLSALVIEELAGDRSPQPHSFSGNDYFIIRSRNQLDICIS